MTLGPCAFRSAAGMLWCAALVACARYGDEPNVEIQVPPRDTFAAPSGILQARCGTLDCHGNPARNLRVYGVYGVRATGEQVTGGADTTETDIDATYQSIVSVDPEGLGAITANPSRDPNDWLVLSKGRGVEAHDGKVSLAAGSPGDVCLLGWIHSETDQNACNEDDFGPVPREGETW